MERLDTRKVLSLLLLLQSAAASDTCSSVIHVDSENGVNQSTCWAQGEAQPCDSLQLALQGDQLATSALVLHQPEDYSVASDNTCLCDIKETDLDDNFAPPNCHTWLERNSVSAKCECGHKIKNLIHCHEDRTNINYASIFNCYCMTLEDNTTSSQHEVLDNGTCSGQLLVGACLYNCFHESLNIYTPYHRLPPDPQSLSDVMCARYKRRGRLCAECMDGYQQPVYSYEINCVKCTFSYRNVLMHILIAFGPSTIFLLFILTCRINCAAPPLSHHIQFIQLITSPMLLRILLTGVGTTTQYRQTRKLVLFLATIYGVWNLDFFRTVIPPICLNISTLSAISLDYLVAVYPLALTVIIYALIELHAHNVRLVVWLWRPFHMCLSLRRQWNIESSIADTFASFMLLSCMKFASVTFDLLLPVFVYDRHGCRRTYLYFDASIEYFGSHHLLYGVMASAVCIVFIVLPMLFLSLYPYFSTHKCPQFLRSRFIADIAKAFHSCYKDGSNGTGNYQCFVVLFFILRILLFATYGVSPTAVFWGLAALEVILAAALFIIIQPYKSPIHNILEVTNFLFMAMSLLSIFGVSTVVVVSPHNGYIKAAMIIIYILAFLPLLYGIGIFLHWLTGNENLLDILKRAMKSCFANICSKCKQQPVRCVYSEGSLPDRLINPDFYH